jgi:hypothetical protein
LFGNWDLTTLFSRSQRTERKVGANNLMIWAAEDPLLEMSLDILRKRQIIASMSTLLVTRGRSGIVCSGLMALCFAAASSAQSTPATGDQIPPASEVKYRHPILQTGRFIAYLLEIPPHEATMMHRHERDILTVFVSGAKTTSTFYGHEPVTDAIPSGEARFRPAGFAHATRNEDSVVFRAVILEFTQSQGALRLQSDEQHYCNQDSPNACVTEKQKICTDGFCVTEIRLAPGAIRKTTVPAGSYAIIAVDDCELSDGLHKSASPHAYRSGDIQYFEAAGSSWKNSGRTEAHLALVSFR